MGEMFGVWITFQWCFINKEYISRLLDISIFQEKHCPRIRLAIYNRKPTITVAYTRKVLFCLAFCFYSWKRNQEACSLGLLSWLLRVSKETQALSVFLLHHSSMWFLFSRSIHSSRWLLEPQPLILLPGSEKRGEKCKRDPPLPPYWLELCHMISLGLNGSWEM